MIAYLKGYVQHITADSIILDVRGVGYYVLCPNYLLKRAQEKKGEEMSLWCVMQVREDATTLYGLEHFDARVLFMTLTRISGVGGRLAINLFSQLGFEGLIEALLQEDATRFQKADGVGPKMAKRLVVELKNQEKALLSKMAQKWPLTDQIETLSGIPQLDEALSALKTLGYREQEVRPLAVSLATQDPNMTTEVLLQKILQGLCQKASNA